jgi:divalent metal cation (Fe/Co/Zn/Cd) transporter
MEEEGKESTLQTARLPSAEPETANQRKFVALLSLFGILLLAALIFSTYWLLTNADKTSTIRDIFIIFLGFEFLLIGIALIILIIQLARLINLLQNEVKPILDSTNEMVNTLRGTTAFLSDNLVEPVMKLNEVIAGFQRLLQILSLMKKK